MRGRPQLEHRLGAVSKMVKQSRQSAGICMRVSWNGRGVHGQEIARIRVFGHDHWGCLRVVVHPVGRGRDHERLCGGHLGDFRNCFVDSDIDFASGV